MRGVAVGSAVALLQVFNVVLWVMDIAEDRPDGEWLTSFLFWDIPS